MFYWDVILVYFVLIFIIVSLYFDLLGAGFTFLLGVTLLAAFGIITPEEMFSGVANQQIGIILLLLLLGSIYRETGILSKFFDKVFKGIRTTKGFMRRIMFIITPLSAFVNNTPLVALMLPYAHEWAKKNKRPISKLLIPLSYAAILGGCTTLIGTSSNLIVNGMVVDNGFPSLDIYDFSLVGIPMIFIGYLYMEFIGYRLLPSKYVTSEYVNTNMREYVIEAQLSRKSPIIGKTVQEAGLRNLPGLFLFQIMRNHELLFPVSNDTIILEEDILFFAGDTTSIIDLLNSNKGLRNPYVGMFARKKHTDLIEIVISHNSGLIGKTLKQENFRAKYDATVIAIHRNGEKINGKLGSVKLRAGDVLLLLVGEKFYDLATGSKDFYIISKVKEFRKIGFFKSFILVFGTILLIVLASFKLINLFIGLIVFLSLLLLLKITNPKQLAKSIDYDLAFIIVMALALGIAMHKTGVAEGLSNLLIDIFRPWGSVGILAGLYIITSILAAFITNKAAIAISFPIAISIARDLGLSIKAFILVIAFAAAANFMTPIGYQTNTMVYGPGQYKFRDFIRVGLPLTILYAIVTVFILSWKYL